MLCRVEKDLAPISENIWQILEEIQTFLKPFALVTKYMSGSKYPTLSSVIPYFNRLCDHLEDTISYYRSGNNKNKVYDFRRDFDCNIFIYLFI